MQPLFLMTPKEVSELIGQSMRQKRLKLNLTQKTLAEKSGVSLSVLKQFENTGKIALQSMLKLALILGELENIAKLFDTRFDPSQYTTMAQLINEKERKRGRK